MSTHRVMIDLPSDSYDVLRRLVESGSYASESDVVSNALLDICPDEPPRDGEPAFERWLREEVLAADDELEADPSSGLTPAELRASLAEARLARR